MSDRRFTAQKLRQMEAVLASGDVGQKTRDEAARMLGYAAEMVERCEKEYSQMKKNIEAWPNHGDETVFANQILWMLERILGKFRKEELQ